MTKSINNVFRYSRNSEANASILLDYLEDIFTIGSLRYMLGCTASLKTCLNINFFHCVDICTSHASELLENIEEMFPCY